MLGNRKSLKKALCSSAAIALISAAGLTVASDDANATASAYAALEVHQMAISFSSGGLGDIGVEDGTGGGGGFTSFQFTLQPLSVTHQGLPGSPITSPGVEPNSSFAGTTSGATLDRAQLCLIDCTGFTENDYIADVGGSAVAITNGAGNHAVSDSNMLNTVLDGSSRFGTQAGASSVGGGTLASGSVQSGNQMNWNFNTDDDDAGKLLFLNWQENRLVEILTTRDGETAAADFSFTITLTNNTLGGTQTLFDLDPSTFTSIGAPPVDVEEINDINVNVSLDNAGVLSANSNYSLVFTFDSFATATSTFVPEPAAIGLLGVGLLGLGALRHRRRQKKA